MYDPTLDEEEDSPPATGKATDDSPGGGFRMKVHKQEIKRLRLQQAQYHMTQGRHAHLDLAGGRRASVFLGQRLEDY